MKVLFYKKMFNGQMRDFVRIPITESRDVFESPVRPQDIQRFPKEWAVYKEKEKKPVSGTELVKLPGISEDKRVELEVKEIETIEDLAKAKVTDLEAMGDVYIQLQEIAKLHIKANPTKPKLKVVEEKETK
tara:strand:- start:126 stop:518 length:393 start_codon:yes stop_codon:yes gene_type:complete